MNKDEYINCHTHIETSESVPDGFIPFITKWLSKPKFSRGLARVLHKVTWWSNNDIFDRFMTFLNTGNYPNQKAIFDEMIGYYPDNFNFGTCSMDMAYMGAGKVKQKYLEGQLAELAHLKEIYGNKIMPMVCVDPRRDNILNIVKWAAGAGFAGIKLYPALGYYPGDRRLDPIYKFAEENNLPIISHCGIDGAVHARGNIKKLLNQVDQSRKRYKNLWNYFGEPSQYIGVVNRFPKLKICLAHMGGGSEVDKYLNTSFGPNKDTWFNDIKKLIRLYPNNIYTDTSFTMANDRFHPVLLNMLKDKTIRNNVLFGTDFYMATQKISEREFCLKLISFIGEEMFAMIACLNPRRFFGIKK